jgi:uncharacterized protein (UPF0332 family)
MTGDEFIFLADRLLANPQDEAACRTSISRAYYGAFHLVRAFLIDLGVKVNEKREKHGDLWNCLASSRVIIAKQIATKLAMLHENRITADYKLDSAKPRDVAFARDNLERAKDIQNQLRTCSKEPERSQIKAGIETSSKR